MMRITGGTLQNRRVDSRPGKAVRPTSARLREALFNVLEKGVVAQRAGRPLVEGANVLDVCCGSGVLGLEALSRGAKRVTFVDGSQDSLEIARRNADRLGVRGKTGCLRADLRRLPPSNYRFDLIFLDPPYDRNLVAPALTSLMAGGWLADGAVIAVEHHRAETVSGGGGYELLEVRDYGQSCLSFLYCVPQELPSLS